MIVSFMIRVKLYKIQTLIGYSYLGILEYLCLTRHDKVVLRYIRDRFVFFFKQSNIFKSTQSIRTYFQYHLRPMIHATIQTDN